MTELRIERYEMPAASLGREDPLPDLGGIGDAHEKIQIDETTITPEESKYMGWGRVSTILPYTLQDGYGRKRRTRGFKAAVLENEHLKAVFLLQLGGRLWSLIDKDTGRELLHRNPVFQPCNLALRNAWISGGVEWNCGIIGHTPFTVDDMACERLTFSDGTPVLRMYQYERVRHLFYRVEAFLPEGARELYVRVRIDNATKEDTAVYWWSNMAVDERDDVRIVVPAEKAYRYGYGGKLSKVPVPYMTVEADKLTGHSAELARANGGTLDWDVSHPKTLPQSIDFFFDLPKEVRPFIAAPGGDGYGMCQTSTGELRGRKLFVWGMGAGGRHWQEFLSKKGSAYVELQAGLAHTQLEHLPMAGGASISWLESYGAVRADPEKVHDPDWDTAVRAVAEALESQRPAEALETWHARAKRELDGRSGEVLHGGMGFARCERALLGKDFDTAGLDLDAMRITGKEALWLQLAEEGVLRCPDPLEQPLSYQTGRHWEEALRRSVESGKSDHWYAHYHLGVMADARGDAALAKAEYERSIAQTPNPWAMRCLAVRAHREDDDARAADLLLRAVRMVTIRPLVVEAMDSLMRIGRWDDMLALAGELPETLAENGRVKTFIVAALLRTGRTEEAGRLLNGPFVLTDVREGQVLLTDLWFEYAALRGKGEATPETIAWARATQKPPRHLDFRMN